MSYCRGKRVYTGKKYCKGEGILGRKNGRKRGCSKKMLRTNGTARGENGRSAAFCFAFDLGTEIVKAQRLLPLQNIMKLRPRLHSTGSLWSRYEIE